MKKYLIGLDVGSTTVKAVVFEKATGHLIWQDYQRHETRPAEKVLTFLKRIEGESEVRPGNARIFVTGSGGGLLGPKLGGKFVQEVHALSLAVEKLHPDVSSVIELGGQDAKMIFFNEVKETGQKQKTPTMNDKCAGGTGAVIDKINAKLKLPPERLCKQGYRGLRLHPVAGKCGVFAESDINSLQKMGIPNDELMASLFEAIVVQNLSVLTRGNTIRPVVLLLGGPNTYIRGLQEAWRENIPKIWEERGLSVPNRPVEELIRLPENAQYYGAMGTVVYGLSEEGVGAYRGYAELENFIRDGGTGKVGERAHRGGLVRDAEELTAFRQRYQVEKFVPRRFLHGTKVEAFIGLDGGSTSTKAVLLDKDREVIAKAYQLSKGNPIQDSIEVIGRLQRAIEDQGAALEVLGVGVTGYAKDILKETLLADAGVVETVAHTESALHEYPDADVVLDIGGQDIKVMILREGRVKDFRLNTQCSAGNGYFLQATALDFGIPVEEFAERAFQAKNFPEFSFGCVVFLQSDIVEFQRQGWTQEEILAGLANVLPKNVWLYICRIPNLASLGRRFVLQGGTQHNLAAVKAQVDFIQARFRGKEVSDLALPEIVVHRHCGEAGAIGAAFEAIRLFEAGRRSTFIGLTRLQRIEYQTTRNEETRCLFCKNQCLRTFIDVKTDRAGEGRRVIVASCEKGMVEGVEAMHAIKKEMEGTAERNPNLAQWAAVCVWKPCRPPVVADPIPARAMTPKGRRRTLQMRRRASLKIGIPRLLNLYSINPLFSAYFESLGILPQNLVYSDFTDEKLYREGAKRGAIDPCFPSKLAIPHVHNLLFKHHPKKRLDLIFFPMIDDLPTSLCHVVASRACPTVTATPEAVKAAFTKETDLFAEKGVVFLDTFLNVGTPRLFERQMFHQFAGLLGLSPEENARAVAEGYKALRRFEADLRSRSRNILEMLEREERLGIVVLGRPYHKDPGINHEILEKLQKLGYPILTQDSLPSDPDLEIGDVWKNSFSENANRKLWAAKFVARHPNLVALEFSSFKCGHDAPIYSVVEGIIERSGTPYFCFKDLDENNPAGSIKLRLETIHYFLTRYREDRPFGVWTPLPCTKGQAISTPHEKSDPLACGSDVPRPDHRDAGVDAAAGQVDLVDRRQPAASLPG